MSAPTPDGAGLRDAVEAIVAGWEEAPSLISVLGEGAEWKAGWLRALEQASAELRALLAAHQSPPPEAGLINAVDVDERNRTDTGESARQDHGTAPLSARQGSGRGQGRDGDAGL